MTAAIARPPQVPLSKRFKPLSTRIDMDDLHRITPDIHISLLAHSNSPSIYLNTTLFGKRDTAAAKALINSGATGNLINTEFVKTHRITPKTLKSPLRVRMADDSGGLITHSIDMGLEIQDASSEHREQIRLNVAEIGDHDIILRTDWLIEHNPEINWKRYELSLTRCPPKCETTGVVHVISTSKHEEDSTSCPTGSCPATSRTKRSKARRQGMQTALLKNLWTPEEDLIDEEFKEHVFPLQHQLEADTDTSIKNGTRLKEQDAAQTRWVRAMEM